MYLMIPITGDPWHGTYRAYRDPLSVVYVVSSSHYLGVFRLAPGQKPAPASYQHHIGELSVAPNLISSLKEPS